MCLVIKEHDNGNIVFADFEGLKKSNLKEFIKQPTEGILYDLNRNAAVVLTFIDDTKWVNDYAMGNVVEELKRQLEEMKEEKRSLYKKFGL